MADRVYPSAKPAAPPSAAAPGNGAAGSSFPAPKPQMYQRPIYRPQAPAKRRRGGRSCRCSLCCCLCWFLLAVFLLAFVAAVAGGAFYLLYRPQRPSFTVSSVRMAALNLSSTSAATGGPATLASALTLTLTAKNPNKKVVYVYDDLTLTASTPANGVPLGTAVLPGFAHQAGNTTVLAAALATPAGGVTVDPSAAGSDVKRSGSFAVALDAETRAGVRVGSLRTKKIGIQVRCEGIKVTAPAPKKVVTTKKLTTKGGSGKKNGTALLAPAPAPAADGDDAETTTPAAATVSTAAHACEVRVRVKIGRWTF